MKRWTCLDTALMPDGQRISLHEHDGSYSVRIGGAELMSTRRHASEEKIAQLACAHIAGIQGARVLIGGLGFGFTLQAALSSVRRDAAVIVAEIQAAVIAWNRNPSLPLAAGAMADARVTVLHEDVHEVIRKNQSGFDSIILDVDNGPAALSTERNRRLYDLQGLQMARGALRPQGCLAVWSAGPDAAFGKLLARAGFRVEIQRCRAHASSGGWHTVFLGRPR